MTRGIQDLRTSKIQRLNQFTMETLPLSKNHLWHTLQTNLVMDLTHDYFMLSKSSRQRWFQDKLLPGILPFLIDQFYSETQVSNRYKAVMAVFAGLNYSLLRLKRSQSILLPGMACDEVCECIHHLLLGLLSFLYHKLKAYVFMVPKA